MSSSVDQWQDAGGVSGMLKMFMDWLWVKVWSGDDYASGTPPGFLC